MDSVQKFVLSNGVEVPVLGYGVFRIDPHECVRCVREAIEVGYRHIDTAQYYENEEAVGRGIRESKIAREDVFVTTKIWINNYGYELARASLADSLAKLELDYVDLVLIHQPFGDYYGAYRALEEAYSEGRIRAIGVSNFAPNRLADMVTFQRIAPMVNQIETHPFRQQLAAQNYMREKNILMQAWSPLGRAQGGLLENESLREIAQKHGKTVPQIILRSLIERGIVPIVKTVNIERMRQNVDIFDFALDEDDVASIAALNRNETLFFEHETVEAVERFSRFSPYV